MMRRRQWTATARVVACVHPRRCFAVLSGISEDLLISTSIGHQIGGQTHDELVDSLVRNHLVSPRVERAFRQVDRKAFVPRRQLAVSSSIAYENRPLKIASVATISTPQQHAQVISLLEDHLQPGNRALDIGCGSGFLVAIMAQLVVDSAGPGHDGLGFVKGVDIVPQLVEFARRNCEKVLDDVRQRRVTIEQSTGNGQEFAKSFAQEEPYDCIHVGVAVETKAEAEEFLQYLKPGGALLVPLGQAHQEQKLVKLVKNHFGEVTKTDIMSVLCQPMLQHVPAEDQEEDQEEDHLTPLERRRQRLHLLENNLKKWRDEFEQRQGKRPTRQNLLDDAHAKELFEEFAALRK